MKPGYSPHKVFISFIVAVSATVFYVWPTDALAGCKINLAIENKGTGNLHVNSAASKVKVKGGTWRRLYKGDWDVDRVKAGETKSDVYKAAMKCRKRRQYQINFTCTSGSKKDQDFVRYYPKPHEKNPPWIRGDSATIPIDKCT